MKFRPNTDAGTVVIEEGGEEIEKTPKEAIRLAFDVFEAIEDSPDTPYVSLDCEGLTIDRRPTDDVLAITAELAETAHAVEVYSEVEDQ